jgi:hypothetical protein
MAADPTARAFALCAQDNVEELQTLVPQPVSVNKRVFLSPHSSIKTSLSFSHDTPLHGY